MLERMMLKRYNINIYIILLFMNRVHQLVEWKCDTIILNLTLEVCLWIM